MTVTAGVKDTVELEFDSTVITMKPTFNVAHLRFCSHPNVIVRLQGMGSSNFAAQKELDAWKTAFILFR